RLLCREDCLLPSSARSGELGLLDCPSLGSLLESPNHSLMRTAASRIVQSSRRLTKSRMFPPDLQSPKQFQQFFFTLTRNCVGFVPLWSGHAPVRLSPFWLRLNRDVRL